jgi:hypothetical protein
MILLFGSEYKGVDRTFCRRKAAISSKKHAQDGHGVKRRAGCPPRSSLLGGAQPRPLRSGKAGRSKTEWHQLTVEKPVEDNLLKSN